MPELSPERLEEWAEKVHHAYCAERLRQTGEEYWTKGDYSLLDEDTKEFDRVMVRLFLTHIDSLQAKVDAVRNDECMGWVLYHEESRNIRYRVLDNLNRSHEPDEEDDS